MTEEARTTKLEKRLADIWKTYDVFPERFGVPRNPCLDRPGGLNYNHIVGNGIGCIQGEIGSFKETRNLEHLEKAEQWADELETYFELLEKHEEYRQAEFSGDGLFREIRNAERYASESKKRLEGLR